MSKFEDKVHKMDTGVLKVLQKDLEEKIAHGKIGFGKRARNLLLSTIGVAGIGTIVHQSYTSLDNRSKVGFAPIAVGLGAIIASTLIFNSRTKKNNEEKLSFVNTELERRGEKGDLIRIEGLSQTEQGGYVGRMSDQTPATGMSQSEKIRLQQAAAQESGVGTPSK